MQTDFKHVEYTIPHVMNYLRELNEIKGCRMRTRDELKDEAGELVRHPQTRWHWIYDGPECEKNFRGFLAIGFRDNCHPLCDYFVAQTYTVPEYRRQGVMRRYFTQWAKMHRGATLCMFIIDNNEIAKKFWFSLMPSIGYEPMYLTEVLPPDGYTTQYGWRPKRD